MTNKTATIANFKSYRFLFVLVQFHFGENLISKRRNHMSRFCLLCTVNKHSICSVRIYRHPIEIIYNRSKICGKQIEMGRYCHNPGPFNLISLKINVMLLHSCYAICLVLGSMEIIQKLQNRTS